MTKILTTLSSTYQSIYPEVTAASFIGLAKIEDPISARIFTSFNPQFVAPIPEPITIEGSILSELIPLLIQHKRFDNQHGKSVNLHINSCINAILESTVTLEGHRSRIHAIKNIDKVDDLAAALKRISKLESYASSNPRVLNLLESQLAKQYFDIVVGIQDERCIQIVIDLFYDLEQQLSAKKIPLSAYTKLLKILSDEEDLIDQVAQIDNMYRAGMPIELVFSWPKWKEQYCELRESLEDARLSHLLPNLYTAICEFAERVHKYTEVAYDTALEKPVEFLNEDFYAHILTNPLALEKFVLVFKGNGIPEAEKISSIIQLRHLLTELSAHFEIESFLHSDHVSATQERQDITVKYGGDNPPFSLDSTDIDSQVLFQQQIDEIFIRQADPHYGFWADTYNFRHTPIGRKCLFDEVAVNDFGANLYVIPAADISKYPGRGRLVRDLDTTKLFGKGANFKKWSSAFDRYNQLSYPSRKITSDVIKNLSLARILQLRAFEAYSVPNEKYFNIHGINFSLIIWNQHFDATGVRALSLVPTPVLTSFINQIAISYNPLFEDFPSNHGLDISEVAPTLKAISKRCKEMGLPIGVINPTQGSCFTGGFCNGFEIGSEPYHIWERGLDKWTDAFAHFHKYHIRTNQEILDELWNAHDDVYEVTSTLLNLRDVYKMLFNLSLRDQFNRDSERIVTHGSRALEYFSEFYSDYKSIGTPKNAPVLVIAPVDRAAPNLDSPIVLDGLTGFAFHQWGKPFDMQIKAGRPSDSLLGFWRTKVDPWLADRKNLWQAPRLIARENAEDLINDYKKGN